MYKKTITYEDYNGEKRTEDFYFNLTQAEVAELQFSIDGGYSEMLTAIVKNKDNAAMLKFFKDLIAKSYGIKSEDGRRFIKKPEYIEEFMETPAYSALFMEFITDENAMTEFFNKVIPADLAAEVEKVKKENPAVTALPSKT